MYVSIYCQILFFLGFEKCKCDVLWGILMWRECVMLTIGRREGGFSGCEELRTVLGVVG